VGPRSISQSQCAWFGVVLDDEDGVAGIPQPQQGYSNKAR